MTRKSYWHLRLKVKRDVSLVQMVTESDTVGEVSEVSFEVAED